MNVSDLTNKDRGIDGETRATARGAAKTLRAPDDETAQSSSFSSTGSSARDAISRFNPKSIAEKREYGGTLYRPAGSNKVRYVLPPNVQAPGAAGGHVDTKQPIPAGAVEVGRWHTHGRTENYTDEDFSDADLRLARARGLRSYLGTPKGAVKVAVPVKSGVVILDLVPAEGTRPNIRSVRFPP